MQMDGILKESEHVWELSHHAVPTFHLQVETYNKSRGCGASLIVRKGGAARKGKAGTIYCISYT